MQFWCRAASGFQYISGTNPTQGWAPRTISITQTWISRINLTMSKSLFLLIQLSVNFSLLQFCYSNDDQGSSQHAAPNPCYISWSNVIIIGLQMRSGWTPDTCLRQAGRPPRGRIPIARGAHITFGGALVQCPMYRLSASSQSCRSGEEYQTTVFKNTSNAIHATQYPPTMLFIACIQLQLPLCYL